MNLVGLSSSLMTDTLLSWLDEEGPEAGEAIGTAHGLVVVGKRKKSIADYQALVLWGLARQYDHPGERILEIGTYYGFSAGVLGLAAPTAEVITLNPTVHEAEAAATNLLSLPNVRVRQETSWDFLARETGLEYAMVFVDGDHNAVVRDVPWFDRLRVGGLILFHDYTPGTSAVHPCQPVYNCVGNIATKLGRDPDVLIVDESSFGMAGFYRRGGETLGGAE